MVKWVEEVSAVYGRVQSAAAVDGMMDCGADCGHGDGKRREKVEAWSWGFLVSSSEFLYFLVDVFLNPPHCPHAT